MPTDTRAKPTPSLVSDEITAILHREVVRLEKVQRGGKLEPADLQLLLTIGAAMREIEEVRVGAVVNLLGHRFKHRDVPDDVLKPLLDAMTGADGK